MMVDGKNIDVYLYFHRVIKYFNGLQLIYAHLPVYDSDQ